MPTATAERPASSAKARLVENLRQAPATVPALAAIALFVLWATSQAGYPLTHWAPGGLIVLALLVIAALTVPLRLSAIPLPVRIAGACLAAYTALSYLSILWAGVPGDAWEGANRTLLYLLVFVLFAAWPQRGPTAALLLTAWTLAMTALAAYTALRVDTGSTASLFLGARLVYPTGYPNANAAQWLMAFWPALLLARSERLWWGLRGVLAGGAVLLGAVALLSQSRGSVYATPVMLVLVFALVPRRVRTFVVLLPVAVGLGTIVATLLRVGERLEHGSAGAARVALHSATVATFAAAGAVCLVVAAGAALESRRPPSPATAPRARRWVGAVALLGLVAVLAGGWAAAGDPLTRIEHGWQTFKGGYAADATTGNRLVSGLGSNRYDFYRVALDEFVAHPVAGIGADNFAEQYLRHGRSEETPHYPHSVELRTLVQTGLVGALLALVGLGAALLAGVRAMRARDQADPLGRAVAAAALAGFAYWVVHGSVDWFWEFAGLGAPAFALLGLSCALAPRRPLAPRPGGHTLDGPGSGAPEGVGAQAAASLELARPGFVQPALPAPARPAPPTPASRGRAGGRWGARRPALAAAMLVVALIAAASLAAPWLSQLEVQSAARVWPVAPAKAYARLNEAASLNPLSDEPYLVAGSIALREGDLGRADHEFALALGRVPGDAYATLERGAIASTRGEQAAALALLQHAVQLNPRDPLARRALLLVRRGERVDVTELNRSILREAQQLS
jgi:tetratricopeptide (TPR) repeat protein